MTETPVGDDKTAAPEAPEVLEAPAVPAQQPRVNLAKPDRRRPSAARERITFQSMADRLTVGLVAAVLGAVLVFVSAFLTWSSVHAEALSGSRRISVTVDSLGVSGNRLGTATLVLSIAALALVAVMLLPATKPWAWKALLGTGALIALLALIDMLSLPSHPTPDRGVCSDVTCHFTQSIGPGMWFTLLTGLLVAAGAFVHHLRPVPLRPPAAPTGLSETQPAQSGVA